MARWRVTVTFHGEHEHLEPVVGEYETRDGMERAVAGIAETMTGSAIRYRVTITPLVAAGA